MVDSGLIIKKCGLLRNKRLTFTCENGAVNRYLCRMLNVTYEKRTALPPHYLLL